MKIKMILLVIMVLSMPAFGQTDTDSLMIKDEWSDRSSVIDDAEIIIYNKKSNQTSDYNNISISVLGRKYSKSRRRSICENQPMFYFGLTNYMKGGSIYAPTGNNIMALNWSKSYSFHFNPIHFGIPLSNNNTFGIVIELGLEYQTLSFDDEYTTIKKDENGVITSLPINSEYDVRRNRFKNIYFNVPITLKWQINKIHISAGVIAGVSLFTRTKVVYDYNGDKHKDKDTNNFNIIPFKVDATVRLGYGSFSLFSNYTLTEMFIDNNGPDLHPLVIGVSIGF